ncbi:MULTISPECIES: (d)CMP kinase [Sphingomonas]|uniref:Cytidylate kinase n=1 Tax=Sphingomonas carotinifaciens TaxID=1166323 RepID=A0A1G7HV61_9SPHN|nr:d(CMP) kinase [Sphingomonas carotinifaciens]MBB4085108.1 cytidylate kinase [Sphingomonas carotinifaciens]MWC44486.1 (d)CMP kinase [Sphingomonas carotinifaciens]SDF04223.1 cytidylate kinase [Sphingomonas carotinifaciens]
MIIAVDGPAASGKGTIAKALARHFGLPHLDTGLLYRAVAATVRRLDLDPSREADAVAACDFDELTLADPSLRDDETGQLASIVSAHPLVRAALLQRQKRFAHQPGGAILDGRDIGTVIAPDADAKLFVKASPQVRARRRHAELTGRGSEASFDQVLADIRARDARDSARATAPLTQAADAAALDTSNLTIDASVARAIALVEARLAARAADA